MSWDELGGNEIKRASGFWPGKDAPVGAILIGRLVAIESDSKYDNRVLRIQTVSGVNWPVAESRFLEGFGFDSLRGQVLGIRYSGSEDTGKDSKMKTFDVRVFGPDFPNGASVGDPEPANG